MKTAEAIEVLRTFCLRQLECSRYTCEGCPYERPYGECAFTLDIPADWRKESEE